MNFTILTAPGLILREGVLSLPLLSPSTFLPLEEWPGVKGVIPIPSENYIIYAKSKNAN